PALAACASLLSPSAALHRDRHSLPTRRSSDLSGSCSPSTSKLPVTTPPSSSPPPRPPPSTSPNRGCSKRLPSSRLRGCVRWTCGDRKSTRLNSSHVSISYAVFCLKQNNNKDRM